MISQRSYNMKITLIKLTVIYICLIIILELLGVFNRIPKNNVALNTPGNEITLTGKIISDPEQKDNKISFILETDKINDISTKGNVLVNVYVKTNLLYGDIVSITGKFFIPKSPTVPGTFNYKKYLFRKKIYSILSVTSKDNIKVLDSKPSFIWQLSYKLRKNILQTYNNNLSEQQSAVLSGITIGEKSGLTPYIQKIFTDAGVMHVLVVSGSNVAFIALIFFWIFRNVFRIKKKIAFGLLIPIILFYAMITGANPPVVRATVMTLVVIITMLLSRNVDIYHSIFFAALIILINNPVTLFDAGFQMSFAATIGIIYFFPKFFFFLSKYKLPKFLNPAPRDAKSNNLKTIAVKLWSGVNWILSIFLVSLAAQIAVAPLLAYYFNKISIIALISNIFILPLIEISLISGFILYLASIIVTPMLFITAKISDGLVFLIIYLIDFFANIPHSTIRVFTPPIYFIILFYIIIIGLFKVKQYIWKWILILSMIILSIIPLFNNLKRNKNMLSITFLDVGLGNAIYCEFPNGSNMLVDGGGSWNPEYDIGENVVSPYLWNKKITNIDNIVLTNRYLNHYRGLISVCRNFKIKRFITTNFASKEGEYFDLLKTISEKNIPVEFISINKYFDEDNCKISILPFKDSLIMNIKYCDFSLLICNDISKETQNMISDNFAHQNILLVPNYGKKVLSDKFLLKILPEYAIISTDSPSLKVLEQLKNHKIFSTSDYGTITINSDGEYIEVTN
ncbi:MAG TPA: DNA internalization-related competence protein ComEC/Rec2 [Elusimicrobia bacterium]|nr:DNA internalization-related competence protein ComEC/Rec2 [Elusimicrobiota bacterium]